MFRIAELPERTQFIDFFLVPLLFGRVHEAPQNQSSPQRWDIHLLQGVKNVAEVAKRVGAHVVLVSSALVTPKNR